MGGRWQDRHDKENMHGPSTQANAVIADGADEAAARASAATELPPGGDPISDYTAVALTAVAPLVVIGVVKGTGLGRLPGA
jgi:hypothetical protein